MQTRDHRLRLLLMKWVWEHAVPRKDDRTLHQILQFANVARPGVPLERSHGLRRNRLDLFAHATAKHLYEMHDKRRNVFPALPERRQQDGEDVQTIIQITAKLPAGYHLHEIPIGRGYQPDIHFVRATAP